MLMPFCHFISRCVSQARNLLAARIVVQDHVYHGDMSLVLPAFLDIVCADFQTHFELIMLWLYAEHEHKTGLFLPEKADINWATQLKTATDNYDDAFGRLLRVLIDKIEPDDFNSVGLFVRLLNESPEICSTVSLSLSALCTTSKTSKVGFACLKALIVNRPPFRPLSLPVLLAFSVDADDRIREEALALCLSLYDVCQWIFLF